MLRDQPAQRLSERPIGLVVRLWRTLAIAFAVAALIMGGSTKPQTIVTNPEGSFRLFRIGDAVSSRNIHAAIYDALRLMKDI